MAITKVAQTLVSGATVGATGVVGSTADLTTSHGGELGIKLTNGATGPTTVPVIQVQFSHNNSSWYDFGGGFSGVTTNSAVTSWPLEIPIGVQYIRINVTTASSGGTAGTPTLDVEITKVSL